MLPQLLISGVHIAALYLLGLVATTAMEGDRDFCRLSMGEAKDVVVLNRTKLFGPPTGGILREGANGYKCWAQRHGDHELEGSTLREMSAHSEWARGSVHDQIMLDKAWDIAFQWRHLNLRPRGEALSQRLDVTRQQARRGQVRCPRPSSGFHQSLLGFKSDYDGLHVTRLFEDAFVSR